MTERTQCAEARRQLAARRLVYACLGMFPVVVATALILGADVTIAGGMSAASALLGLLGYRFGRDATAATAISLALVGQAMAFTAAFAGHPWQMDSHMLIYVAIAAGASLVDIRAIVAAAAFTTLHGLVLGLVLPDLVFPSTAAAENIARALFHGVIVILQTGVLCGAVLVRQKMDATAEARNQRLEEARQQAETERARAAEALKAAEEGRANAVEAARQGEIANARLADERAAVEAAQARAAEAVRREAEERQATESRQRTLVDLLGRALGRLAEGDLTYRITTELPQEYEALRRDFNVAVERLGDAIGEAIATSARIRAESGAISSASEQLSQRTEVHAATLEETASALNELAHSVQSAAETAQDAANFADTARNEATSASEIVGRTVEAMGRIEASSRQIGKVTDLIHDIAFQTNLLALNAGVEAARAGEAGRGFAVVASEVRSLAQRASDAAKDIHNLISESGREVGNGVDLVNKTGSALSGILDAASGTADRIGQIAKASREQSTSLSEITSAANELDQVTQRNAAMFEETASAAQSLLENADILASTMSRFRFGDETGVVHQDGKVRAA